MAIDAETRAKYLELKTRADAAYEAAKPAREAAKVAMQPYFEIDDEICELLDGADVQTCEGCGKPIFEGDKSSQTSDGYNICEECSPTYGDMLRHPENFQGSDCEEMTPEEAKRICDDHLADGGSLTDTMATA